jgi:hypothetical protein
MVRKRLSEIAATPGAVLTDVGLTDLFVVSYFCPQKHGGARKNGVEVWSRITFLWSPELAIEEEAAHDALMPLVLITRQLPVPVVSDVGEGGALIDRAQGRSGQV